MPILIDGVELLSATEVVEKVGVSRQTLWRWRQARVIPVGRRYRGREVVFTADEVDRIDQYANRLEPIDGTDERQLNLFGAGN